MNTKGFFIGRTPPRASFECQVATNAPRVWACAVSTTTSLSSGPLGDSSTCTRGSGPRPRPSAARSQEDEDTMTETDATERHNGVVVGLVLLGAAFVAGGLSGFLLVFL
jgi:hypothetical protein